MKENTAFEDTWHWGEQAENEFACAASRTDVETNLSLHTLPSNDNRKSEMELGRFAR